jgi:hypothetical protein
MVNPEAEIPEATTPPAEARVKSKPGVPQERSADKRAEAIRAKKKKKRDAHRVALRRSHTKG